ncbi:MAG: hypothetical protein ACOZIN_05155 [Myxococcota bacterium]
MNASGCPDLEVLFLELAQGHGPALDHAQGCATCSEILEEHRQLEKDLYRLADPLPPPLFVQQVMAKVAASPAPVHSEAAVGLFVLAGALALCALTFVLGEGNLGLLGVRATTFLLELKGVFVAVGSGLSALLSTAATPTTVSLAAVFLFALFGLWRLAGPTKVTA